jgi:23S rRNA (guanosine2251-2'-O)-methyltransferase
MEDYIAGKHSVLEALRSGRTINKIWLADNIQKQQLQPLLLAAKEQGIVVSHVDKRKLDQMTPGVQNQGVVAQIAAYEYVELDDLIRSARSTAQREPLLLILDEIEDPHNLGSILRTADCAGVDGVIIPKRRSVGLNATVSKTSAGAVEYVPVARVTNIAQTVDRLKEEGIWIAGTDVTANLEVYEADFTVPLAIVIGNENKGVGRLIKEKCDFLVKLPMSGSINSLNASVAAALFMYEAVRQRRSRN